MGYTPQRLVSFTIEQIALGFINALKEEGLQNADEELPRYAFTDTSYADDPVRILIIAAPGAPNFELNRANIMSKIRL